MDEQRDASIVPGKSIEGIKLGDDRLRVVQRLGEPTYMAIGDGMFEKLFYEDRGVEVLIAAATVELPLLVASVDIEAPYTGTTGDGIGIGSSRAAVRSSLGEPTESRPHAGMVADIYRNAEVNFWFFFDEETLVEITMRDY